VCLASVLRHAPAKQDLKGSGAATILRGTRCLLWRQGLEGREQRIVDKAGDLREIAAMLRPRPSRDLEGGATGLGMAEIPRAWR
jgi:hypothetical protein